MAMLWLADVDAAELAAGTKRLYRFATECYILPGVGDLRLREITVPVVERLLASVRTNHGPGAAKSTRNVLSGILGMSVRHGRLPANPVAEASAQRTPRSRPGPRALTPEESQQLRTRIAADTTVVLLERRLATVPDDADAPVIFLSPQGRLRDPNNTSGDLRQAFDRAGYPWVTSHTFRRTVATRLDGAGLSARQIADHLGHSRPSLTQDVYLGRGTANPQAAAALQRSL